MKRPLVLGIGNPLRGDDGFGPAVVEWLMGRSPAPGADLLTVHQLLPEHVVDIAAASRVAFVDVSAELPPTEVEEREVAPATSPPEWTHRFDADHLLRMASQLGPVPPTRLFTAGAVGFAHGEGLTEELATVVAEVGAAIEHWLES